MNATIAITESKTFTTTLAGARIDRIELTRPDDWHLHLRDGEYLPAVLPHTLRQFARAIVMPNLRPPVTTTTMALAYRERILAALPAGSRFEPLMTLYLTDRTTAAEIDTAVASGVVKAVKEIGCTIPVVVRLEGTNVEEGKAILRDSGLAVIPADGMKDAAEKIIAAVAKGGN